MYVKEVTTGWDRDMDVDQCDQIQDDQEKDADQVDQNEEYLRDEDGALIENRNGKYFRQWRDEIKSPNDIWDEIVQATKIPGGNFCPKITTYWNKVGHATNRYACTNGD